LFCFLYSVQWWREGRLGPCKEMPLPYKSCKYLIKVIEIFSCPLNFFSCSAPDSVIIVIISNKNSKIYIFTWVYLQTNNQMLAIIFYIVFHLQFIWVIQILTLWITVSSLNIIYLVDCFFTETWEDEGIAFVTFF